MMHDHYGVRGAVEKLDPVKLRKFLRFRADFITEEHNELQDHLQDPEEVVDALIDICVVAIGTLDLFGVDVHRAWDEVLEANMNKRVGVKESRPNPFQLPDLVKPEGWRAPSHFGNHGNLTLLQCDCEGLPESEKGYDVVAKDTGSFTVYDVHCDQCGKKMNAEDALVSRDSRPWH